LYAVVGISIVNIFDVKINTKVVHRRKLMSAGTPIKLMSAGTPIKFCNA